MPATKHNPLSLASMLMAQVSGQVVKQSERSAAQKAHLVDNHKAQFNKAIIKYRAKLAGRGWLQTKQVEWLVGVNAMGANVFLRKIKVLGYIENRPTGGTDRYFKNRGWDWRWVDGK